MLSRGFVFRSSIKIGISTTVTHRDYLSARRRACGIPGWAGLRWRPSRFVAVAFDPLSLAIVAPVLGSPGIVQLEYRTVLGAEILP